MYKKTWISVVALACTIGASFAQTGSSAASQGDRTLPARSVVPALNRLGLRVERIADRVGVVCQGDVTAIADAGVELRKLRRQEQILHEIQKLHGHRDGFPQARARRLGARIASLEDSLVRLEASTPLDGADASVPKRTRDASGALLFEAVQGICPGDEAASVFDDVCKIQGGTPGESCSDCFFGIFTCCEKICTPN